MWLLPLKALYFFLPAYLANMAPVLFRWIPFKQPVYEKWFGKNKTWRGLAVAIIIGTLVFYLQKLAYISGFKTLAIIDYADFSILLGFLLGTGAILGDLVESHYKRKIGIKPGEPLLIWDQLDYALGGLALALFVYIPPIKIVLIIFLASPLLHVVVNYIGYLLKISEKGI